KWLLHDSKLMHIMLIWHNWKSNCCVRAMQGQKKYQEQLFTSFQLSEHVPKDNFYSRLKDLLEIQWLYKATKKYYGTEGQESIDPVVFFKLILIGYLENQSSDRKIISMTSMRLDMLYFIGYNIDESLPWHSTLSRTRQLYGEEVFQQLFREVLKQCIEKGMVAGRRQAVDSVFVKANASMDSLLEKEILEDGDAYAGSLKEDDQQQAPFRNQHPGNNTHYSSTDADARIATKPGKPSLLNYLAQVSVDTGCHVITNIEAHHADKRDSECLAEVVDHTVSHLQSGGLLVEEIIADTNYSSGTALQYLEDKNITGYIPNVGGYKKGREGFEYHQQNDEYVCQQGNKLVYKKDVLARAGRYKKVYYSSSKDCSDCPLRSQCIGKSAIKKITVTMDKTLYDQMQARMETHKGKRMMKLRQSTVEPVLGTLINFLGMKRVNTIGIKQAGKCMLMAALAYNLKKLLKFRAPKAEIMIKKMGKWQQKAQKCFFQLYGNLYYAIE
ncbi:IS1182 family transposase, partial [Terrimonas pollutisoli]|uniref:IS1182 family transposase n=1 Tax=Terrimonas pollutisoli TaxID=3034147 RepID=UPI0023EDC556